MQFTVATFNVENLFMRFKFRDPKETSGGETDPSGTIANTGAAASEKKRLELLDKLMKDGLILDRDNFETHLPAQRDLTAQAIRALNADFIGLQEVENLDTLRLFNSRHLKSKRFPYQLLIDTFVDPRLIDVAVLSRLPIDFLRTHQFRRRGTNEVFSRDCLEVHVKVGDKTLPIFVNHLKAMIPTRAGTRTRRLHQCEEIVAILEERFGSTYGEHDFIVMGDMNDFSEAGKEQESALGPLIDSKQMKEMVGELPPEEQWTFYFDDHKVYNHLDYMFISNSLARRNLGAKPRIERRGQPLRVNQPGKPKVVPTFFPGIKGSLKASDHCPVVLTLDV